MIDLRSDTVTRPSAEMLRYMFEAEVGDDVFGEDPTVLALEAKAASLFGMENALFCPSGTMTNQIAIKILSQPPGEIICDELSHVYQYEGGGLSFNSGLSPKLLHGDRGRLSKAIIEAAINPGDIHKPESQVIAIENTCNKGGGSIYSLKAMQEISKLADERGLRLHLDGARIFNAFVETDYSPPDIGKLFDTISICLSKGLGCPVGSLIISSNDNIAKARRIRKVLGGGMRQAGYLAAAGIYALDNHLMRLKDDHKRARHLAGILTGCGFVGEIMPVETNIVVFQLSGDLTTENFLNSLKKEGVLAVPFGPGLIRFVTHLDISDEDLEKLEGILKKQ